MQVKVSAISYILPEEVLTNEMISAKHPEISPEEIYRKTGIRKRHKIKTTKPNYLSSDFAIDAAEFFFKEHGIDRSTIDMLIICSEGLDYKAPPTACVVQHKLGLSNRCAAFDIPMGCSGYVYGLATAKAYLVAGLAKRVLFVAQEVSSYIIHPEDVDLVSLFGDASSVSLIEKSDFTGIGEFVLGTDGKGERSLCVDGSGVRAYPDPEWHEKNKTANGMTIGRMQMNGLDIFSFSLQIVPPLLKEVLEKNQLSQEDIDLFVFHQANGFMLEALRRKNNIPKEKFVICMENTGNTVSATIPIALREAQLSGRIKRGDKVLIAGFGIGFSWGATILRF